jgi:hypothetical protein
MAALEPALSLLTALTSLPAAFYYARFLGAAAVHPVRDEYGRPCGLRSNAQWRRTFLVFLASAALVASLGAVITPLASEHAAFGAVLVAALWPHARESTVRASLVLLLLGAGMARILDMAETPASVAAGYVIGVCCAWTVRRWLGRRALG